MSAESDNESASTVGPEPSVTKAAPRRRARKSRATTPRVSKTDVLMQTPALLSLASPFLMSAIKQSQEVTSHNKLANHVKAVRPLINPAVRTYPEDQRRNGHAAGTYIRTTWPNEKDRNKMVADFVFDNILLGEVYVEKKEASSFLVYGYSNAPPGNIAKLTDPAHFVPLTIRDIALFMMPAAKDRQQPGFYQLTRSDQLAGTTLVRQNGKAFDFPAYDPRFHVQKLLDMVKLPPATANAKRPREEEEEEEEVEEDEEEVENVAVPQAPVVFDGTPPDPAEVRLDVMLQMFRTKKNGAWLHLDEVTGDNGKKKTHGLFLRDSVLWTKLDELDLVSPTTAEERSMLADLPWDFQLNLQSLIATIDTAQQLRKEYSATTPTAGSWNTDDIIKAMIIFNGPQRIIVHPFFKWVNENRITFEGNNYALHHGNFVLSEEGQTMLAQSRAMMYVADLLSTMMRVDSDLVALASDFMAFTLLASKITRIKSHVAPKDVRLVCALTGRRINASEPILIVQGLLFPRSVDEDSRSVPQIEAACVVAATTPNACCPLFRPHALSKPRKEEKIRRMMDGVAKACRSTLSPKDDDDVEEPTQKKRRIEKEPPPAPAPEKKRRVEETPEDQPPQKKQRVVEPVQLSPQKKKKQQKPKVPEKITNEAIDAFEQLLAEPDTLFAGEEKPVAQQTYLYDDFATVTDNVLGANVALLGDAAYALLKNETGDNTPFANDQTRSTHETAAAVCFSSVSSSETVREYVAKHPAQARMFKAVVNVVAAWVDSADPLPPPVVPQAPPTPAFGNTAGDDTFMDFLEMVDLKVAPPPLPQPVPVRRRVTIRPQHVACFKFLFDMTQAIKKKRRDEGKPPAERGGPLLGKLLALEAPTVADVRAALDVNNPDAMAVLAVFATAMPVLED